ncbi:YihY/virulence factor BrkB family protein [Mariniluteicoccus flavus]
MLTGLALPTPDPPAPRLIAKNRGTRGPAGFLRGLGRVAWSTILACVRFRVTGLAAEIAFFAILSLPPLLFGLAGGIGFVTSQLPVTTITTFRLQVLHHASRFLTPASVEELIAPTLDEVLGGGRVDIVSIGFLIALWSGSRAMAVFIEAVTIMYGAAGSRGIVRARALSFAIYLGALVTAALVLPLIVTGPGLLDRVLPSAVAWIGRVYWPVVAVAAVAALTTLIHLAIPVRQAWRGHLPGATLTVGFWLVGSWGLREGLLAATGGASIFGPLATPIALLAWLYVTAFAALTGAALNAALAKVAPRWAGVTDRDAAHILEASDPA